MKNWLIILMVLVIPLGIFMFLENAAPNSTANATAASALGKGKIIKFSSPMCTECKKTGEAIENVAPEYSDTIIFENVNVSDGKKDSQKMIDEYRVTVVPTLIFIDKSGVVVQRSEGLADENYIRKNLDKIK